MNVVYEISVNDKIVYIGRTNNIDRREIEHRNGYKRYLANPADNNKQLYAFLSRHYVSPSEIILKPIYLPKTKTEAKRYEMYTILFFYFNHPGQLQQKIPGIKDKAY